MDRRWRVPKRILYILCGIILVALIIGSSSFFLSRSNPAEAGASSLIRPPDAMDHTIGNPNASDDIFIYTDLECPYCKILHEQTLPEVLKAYGPDLYVVYRHFVLPIHPRSSNEGVAAECAA